MKTKVLLAISLGKTKRHSLLQRCVVRRAAALSVWLVFVSFIFIVESGELSSSVRRNSSLSESIFPLDPARMKIAGPRESARAAWKMIKEQPSDDKWACGWKKTKITLALSLHTCHHQNYCHVRSHYVTQWRFIPRACTRACVYIYKLMNEPRTPSITFNHPPDTDVKCKIKFIIRRRTHYFTGNKMLCPAEIFICTL